MVMNYGALTPEREFALNAPRGMSEDNAVLAAEIARAERALAQEAAAPDWFAQEAQRLRSVPKYATITADKLRQLYEVDPDLAMHFTGQRLPESERPRLMGEEGQVRTRTTDNAGRAHAQMTYIAAEDAAAWTRLYPPLRADGFQDPPVRVPRAEVVQRRLAGFAPVPQGPEPPKPTMACDLTSATGGPCPYHGYNETEVLDHQRAKHTRVFHLKIQADERAAKAAEAARAEQNQQTIATLLGEMAAQNRELTAALTSRAAAPVALAEPAEPPKLAKRA